MCVCVRGCVCLFVCVRNSVPLHSAVLSKKVQIPREREHILISIHIDKLNLNLLFI